MRQEGKSGGATLGVMAAATALFLAVFFFFFSCHYCWRVCVHVFFFWHCYAMQYLTLGRTCARGLREGGGQLSECMTTSTSVSSLTAQLAARALPFQLFFPHPPSSIRTYRLQVRCKAGRTGDLVPLKITFST